MKYSKMFGLIYGMMAMGIDMSEYGHRSRNDDEPRIKREENWDKKCFRPECNNPRYGSKLYCSAECHKLDKERREKL